MGEAAASGIVLGLLALEDDRFAPGLIEPVMATFLQMESLSKATMVTDKIPGNEGLTVSLVISWCVNAGHYVVVTDTPVEELVSQFHQDVAHVLKQLFGPDVGVAHLDT